MHAKHKKKDKGNLPEFGKKIQNITETRHRILETEIDALSDILSTLLSSSKVGQPENLL